MEREDLYRRIAQANGKKIVLVVLDGLGGLPEKGRTEMETAATPNLDLLAAESELGLSHPIAPGITPGSGPAHLGLFGYDPLKYEIGRGILEALGVGIEVGARDVTARGNFATLEDGLITDRRAGRIPTERNREIIAHLGKRITRIDDVDVLLTPGEEHRFVVVFRGDGLSDELSDADPEAVGVPPRPARPKSPEAEKTAHIVNSFLERLVAELKGFRPANAALLRGFAKYPAIPPMKELFQLRAAAIAVYPMYRGLAQLVGMDILPTGRTLADEVATLRAHFDAHEFFFLHVKKTDSYGEDGDFAAKVHVIEEFDQQLPALLELRPDVLVVTGDHSTPARMKGHSWHPNPVLLKSEFCRVAPLSLRTLDYARRDPEAGSAAAGEGGGLKFCERTCGAGVLGQFPATDILPLAMAHALKFKKYGA